MEALERRLLLSRWVASSLELADVHNGPMANLGQQMIGVYQSFESSGGQTSQLASQYPSFSFRGTSILAQFKEATPNFNEFQTELESLGLQVTVSSPSYGVVVGWIPMSQLPTAAQMPDVLNGAPLDKPVLRYQGTANNEGDTAMFADVAHSRTASMEPA